MDLGLKNRVAIVTGGSKGVGKAIVELLAGEGVKLVVCARDKKHLTEIENKVKAMKAEIIVVSADVTDSTAVARVIKTAIDHFGSLDILINNAGGVNNFGGFEELADDDWLEAYKLNVMSIVYFVRNAMQVLKKSKTPRIINISSIAGLQPGLFNPHYSVVKAAQVNLTKALANHLAKDKILVNVICPGPFHSHFWDRNVQSLADAQGISFEQAEAKLDKDEAKKIPLGRIGKGEDVAGLVAFLASDQASWITGSCFHVDGGKLRSMC